MWGHMASPKITGLGPTCKVCTDQFLLSTPVHTGHYAATFACVPLLASFAAAADRTRRQVVRTLPGWPSAELDTFGTIAQRS